MDSKFDPVCIVHGKKASEHVCLYCCLCFKSLLPEECSKNDEGIREDVCEKCREMEKNLYDEGIVLDDGGSEGEW